ncbi:DNA polymerase III subunit beta [Candidatus Nomurabacteria bacterium RIFCSPLOWO2_01_FULL_46_18]|uniref:Beta sliding clamp n=1 Tax=Candidatus Nomurabacteria bacterium RIFCSPLOWO2_01_FULL_46_18 TaxID=1801783 RepID=A0A1F6XEP4_9BACT|nr:MAG: DNA polymerase III subunit beta [Candidatus Nomurabacteria bacterium RIFCSPLOWO2_01_FULL_46_18]
MKIDCGVEKIKNGIFQAERVTGKNLTLPVLNSILLIASGKSLKLRATNLSLGIEIEIPAKIEKEGTLAIPGGVLADVFSNILDTESVSLESVDGNLMVKTKRNKVKVKGQPWDDFPTIPTVSGTEFKIEAQKVIDGIKSVYYSSAVSDVKPEISSVYIYSNEDNLIFVATDSFRLAEKKIKVRGAEAMSVLIPFKNIPEILRVFGELQGEVKICFNKNQVSFSAENTYLTSRVVNGIFPDYRQIIPKESKTEAVVLKQELLGALKLSNIFSDKFNQVNLRIAPKEKIFELSSANNDVGENKTHLDAALSGEAVELSFNFKYFLDCFQSIPTDSLSIKLLGAARPIVVAPLSDPSFTYLIMPMNR